MVVHNTGDVYIWNRGQGTSFITTKWEWDGTKPVIKYKDISKNASGYVQPTDTDWSAVTEDNKVIGLNAKGPLVKDVQQSLINIGYSGNTGSPITTDVQGCGDDVEKCDGIYGKSTKEMVKQYQKDNGLSVDGIFGQQTYDAMFAP
jgi:peptidoglycan hydrolase-like protein with peptidoglycan-binding domain